MGLKRDLSGKCSIKCISLLAATAVSAAITLPLTAAVLPEDRFDYLFHRYTGGEVTIDGPSLLFRKQVNKSTSVAANYYVDSISSASIDVVTSASRYSEERTEYSVHVNHLHEKSILSAGYINSDENDFEAQSLYFNISQDMFGDLTTLNMGYSIGDDKIFQTYKLNGVSQRDPNFAEQADRQSFKLGLTQVISKDLVASLNYELITDKGFLNNPYRSIRYSDGTSAKEIYPRTRSSNAASISAKYYLPYRAALYGNVRLFSDTWGISAHSYELGYTHPHGDSWLFAANLRQYSQGQATFYRDVFDPFLDYTYMARDKELSNFNTLGLGLEASYQFKTSNWRLIEKGSFNAKYTRLTFDYDNFSDFHNVTIPTGNEGNYRFSAKVIQLYLSVWY